MSLSPLHPSALADPQPLPASPAPAWKDEVSARIRAHRTRRGRVPENQPALPGMETSASSIAARVAERYARVPSYKEMLAAQAAAAAKAAEAAAAAAEAAHAAAAAVQAHVAEVEQEMEHPPHLDPEPEPWQPDLLRYFVSEDSLPAPRSAPAQAHAESMARARAAAAGLLDSLDDAVVEPDSPLPGRVIEFPRELVAPRKARPRLADGPIAAEAGAIVEPPAPPAADDPAQLRIFEAEPETAAAPRAAARPEWLSIRLDPDKPARPATPPAPSRLADELPLHVAPIADRLMAGVVDVALTLSAFLLFAVVFAACTTHPPAGRTAVAGAAASLLAMWVLYQFLFFWLSAATPGMRYAKIALCTFDEENPTRHAMRVRILGLLLSALPLGMGFLWIFFDEDGLSWHDRITQTYQRSYREQ